MIFFSVENYLPFRRVFQTREQGKERRLAATGFPDQADEFAGSNGDGNAFDHLQLAVLFAQVRRRIKSLNYSCRKTSEGLILATCLPSSPPVRPPITIESRTAKEARVQGM